MSLLHTIREACIGEKSAFTTPFGNKPLIYADYTASGRSVEFIEDYIRHHVLPFYANTHTETSFTGAQSTLLREQARQIIRNAINASEEDKVIFCGSGATTAINKLIDILNLRLPADLDSRHQLQQKIPLDECPLVLIGPYEHHSNELPWRESIAQVKVIPLTKEGQIDLRALEQVLQEEQHRKLVIGSFSAASNVTGILSAVDDITALLQNYNALIFWDYAAGAPYLPINMNPNQSITKDAVFLSTHKFIGGPETPGILIVKKALLKNRVPSVVGGGTVNYVTPKAHYYLDDQERREEAGTPSIIGAIRAGLAFKLQQQVGLKTIVNNESQFIKKAITRWQTNPNIHILGNLNAKRLSIISFQIRYKNKNIHYGFITAALNDIFGIQARGGCSCAGPYGHSLLEMDADYSDKLQQQINAGNYILRPGWVRLNFNYFLDEDTVDYIIEAVCILAEHAHKILPLYNYDQKLNIWAFQNQQKILPSSLLDWDFTQIPAQNPPKKITTALTDFLSEGESSLNADYSQLQHYKITLCEKASALCWFWLPQEINSA